MDSSRGRRDGGEWIRVVAVVARVGAKCKISVERLQWCGGQGRKGARSG